MRHLIVKFFALDYLYNIFGWRLNGARAGTIILPLFCITGILLAFFTPDYPTPTPLLWFVYWLDALVLFFGFVYFRFYPVKWEELDNSQKLQLGAKGNLTDEQEKEWAKILFFYTKNGYTL